MPVFEWERAMNRVQTNRWASLLAMFLVVFTFNVSIASGAQVPTAQDDAAIVAKARRIHDRVLKLDTHNDMEPENFTSDCNYGMRLTTQVDIPKMIDGDMDVSFLIVYVGQGPLTPEGYDNAYKEAIAKFDAIHALTEKIAPDKIGLALTPQDVLRLHRQNKRIAVIGVSAALFCRREYWAPTPSAKPPSRKLPSRSTAVKAPTFHSLKPPRAVYCGRPLAALSAALIA